MEIDVLDQQFFVTKLVTLEKKNSYYFTINESCWRVTTYVAFKNKYVQCGRKVYRFGHQISSKHPSATGI
jgi:hypothetical protein